MGLDEERIEKLEISALFHDTGKIGIPDSILLKLGKLDETELQKIREHPVIELNPEKRTLKEKSLLS